MNLLIVNDNVPGILLGIFMYYSINLNNLLKSYYYLRLQREKLKPMKLSKVTGDRKPI